MSQRSPSKEEREVLHTSKTARELDTLMSKLVGVAAGMLAVVVVPQAMEVKEVVVGTDRVIYVKPNAGRLTCYMGVFVLLGIVVVFM